MQQEPPFVVAIVDDDAGFRDAIGWLLKANGYGVRSYGEPIPSCRVENDLTGAVTSVFWESVDRYGLRRPGETDAEVLDRISDENKSFNDKR